MHIFLCRQLRRVDCDGLSVSRRHHTACFPRAILHGAVLLVVLVHLATASAFAKQGAVRTLYTVPNTTFVEQMTGEDCAPGSALSRADIPDARSSFSRRPRGVAFGIAGTPSR